MCAPQMTADLITLGVYDNQIERVGYPHLEARPSHLDELKLQQKVKAVVRAATHWGGVTPVTVYPRSRRDKLETNKIQ